jgi:hypothetical protein
MFETAAASSFTAISRRWPVPCAEQPPAPVFYALVAGACLVLHECVHALAARARPKALRAPEPGRCYDPVLKMLADEQGDWYVEKVLSHELGKVLTHNTRDLDARSLSEGESGETTPADSEEWEESEEESGEATSTSDEEEESSDEESSCLSSSDEEAARRAAKKRARKRPGRRRPPPVEPKPEDFFAPAGDPPPSPPRGPGRKKPPPRPPRPPPPAGLWPAAAYVAAWTPTAGTGGEPGWRGGAPPPPREKAGREQAEPTYWPCGPQPAGGGALSTSSW